MAIIKYEVKSETLRMPTVSITVNLFLFLLNFFIIRTNASRLNSAIRT